MSSCDFVVDVSSILLLNYYTELHFRLDKIEPDYWVICVCLAALAELANSEAKEAAGKQYTAGDCAFDPLKLMPEDKQGKMEILTKEIKHGHLSMMAVLGYVVQEALYSAPVTAETPFFFQPIS